MPLYKLIYNPVAGKGVAQKAQPKVEALLHEYGLEYDLALTEYPGHATDLARSAAEAGFAYVIVAGGDGTVNEAVNGLMEAREHLAHVPVLGVIPVGRGNDFSFGLDIPYSIEEACALVAAAPRRWVDMGKVTGGDLKGGLYFGNGVGVGFDAVVGFVAAKMKLTGMLAYLVAALKTIFIYYKSPLVKLTLDTQTITIPALLVSIMNGRRMGGGFLMAPDSHVDDGIFNLCIVREVPRMKMFGLIAKIMKGTQSTDPAVQTVQSKKIIVTAEKGSLPVHADGVTVCESGQEIVVEIIPGGLEVITK
ncbi:MAG TPA: diacylglycerol kinase family lipid kinase [Anaerolineaceae bacterium]|nr:diacylglycerol kinase family lipid kinase [Anaerolineaceae bacterium]